MRSPIAFPFLLLFVLQAGCTSQEEQVLTQFFMAVQSGDEDAVSSISLAAFPGGVESWEIVEVGEESLASWKLPDVHEALLKARSELSLTTEQNSNYAGDHREKFEEYKKRRSEDPEHQFGGDMAEFQAAWEERLAEQSEIEKQVAKLEEELKALRAVAGMSLNAQVNEKFAGDVKQKDVTLRVVDGADTTQYRFTLERYDLTDTERNLSPIARWVITGIEELG